MRPVFMLALLACTASSPQGRRVSMPSGMQRTIIPTSSIDSAVASLLASRSIPGAAVAILRHDSLVYARGFGAVDLATRAPVTPKTVFQIASTTKPFTAIAVLMLVEEGRIDLDAPASRYLSWLPGKYAGITGRQLLTHTSGVSPDMRTANIDEFDVSEFRRRLEERPVSSTPGSRVQYANTGFTLLSFIVESVSGDEFGSFLRHRIFAPLGMESAGYRAPQQPGAVHARGYELVSGELTEAPHVFSGWGNSGIEASVLDMAKFAAALEQKKLLRPGSYDLMYAPARLKNGSIPRFTSNGVPTQFGLSWFLSNYRGSDLISHGGAVAGFSSSLDRFVRDGWTIIVLSNGKQGTDRQSQASAVARAVADLVVLRSPRSAEPAAASPVSSAPLPSPPVQTRDTASVLWREVATRNRAMEAAFNRSDLMAVARFYTDDARIVGREGNADAAGRAELDRYWSSIRGGRSWQLEVLDVGGLRDAPYQVGRSTLVFDPGNGERTVVTHFLVVWRREPSGELRIALDYYH